MTRPLRPFAWQSLALRPHCQRFRFNFLLYVFFILQIKYNKCCLWRREPLAFDKSRQRRFGTFLIETVNISNVSCVVSSWCTTRVERGAGGCDGIVGRAPALQAFTYENVGKTNAAKEPRRLLTPLMTRSTISGVCGSRAWEPFLPESRLACR